MKVGSSSAIKFKVKEQSGNEFTSDTVKTSAAVVIADKSVLSYDNGKIVALKAGSSSITVKIDGKSVTYTVTVS